jgi:sugar phosphate isomerase/epimerase
MQRREFLSKTAQAAALLAVLPNLSCAAKTSVSGEIFKDFGIQLWTLRDVINDNPKDIITQVGKMGFTQIESFEGKEGIFWGMKPKEFQGFLQDQNLKFVSAHCDWTKDLQQKAADVASIGGKYIVCPWLGPQKTIDDYKKAADQFNQAGEICKKEGLRFAYHNHDYSFVETEGQIPQDIFMNNTDPSLVDFEMDMYWVVTAGVDPIDYMEKHKNRFKLCHIKDRTKDSKEQFDSCSLGEGSIDYATVLKKAKSLEMEYFIYEQEKYNVQGVLANAKTSADYLKSLVLK